MRVNNVPIIKTIDKSQSYHFLYFFYNERVKCKKTFFFRNEIDRMVYLLTALKFWYKVSSDIIVDSDADKVDLKQRRNYKDTFENYFKDSFHEKLIELLDIFFRIKYISIDRITMSLNFYSALAFYDIKTTFLISCVTSCAECTKTSIFDQAQNNYLYTHIYVLSVFFL